MKKSLKTLSFDRQIKEQNLAFIFLEKIRYKQTRFITKLVMDFIESTGIDINNYDEVIRKCQSYIEGNEAISLSSIDNHNDIKTILSIVEEINKKISSENISNNPTVQIGLSKNFQNPPDPHQNFISNLNTETIEEPDDNLGDMLSSFRTMANS